MSMDRCLTGVVGIALAVSFAEAERWAIRRVGDWGGCNRSKLDKYAGGAHHRGFKAARKADVVHAGQVSVTYLLTAKHACFQLTERVAHPPQQAEGSQLV